MKNYPNETHTPFSEYREPLEAHNDFQASSPASYHQPSEGGYQQQEQLYGPQRSYGEEQPYYTPPPIGTISPNERSSMGMRARTAGWLCYLGAWVTGLVFLLLER